MVFATEGMTMFTCFAGRLVRTRKPTFKINHADTYIRFLQQDVGGLRAK